MSKLKAVALLAVTALVGGLLIARGPAVASPTDAPRADRGAEVYLFGIVSDQLGEPVDDVLVELLPADDLDAEPVATSLTYANEDYDSHGYYMLYIPFVKNAEYRVRFSSLPGAEDPFRTVVSDTYTVKNKNFFEQLDVTMALKRKVDTKTEVGKPGKATTGDNLDIDATVTTKELKKLEGSVSWSLKGTSKKGSATLVPEKKKVGISTVSFSIKGVPGPKKVDCGRDAAGDDYKAALEKAKAKYQRELVAAGSNQKKKDAAKARYAKAKADAKAAYDDALAKVVKCEKADHSETYSLTVAFDGSDVAKSSAETVKVTVDPPK